MSRPSRVVIVGGTHGNEWTGIHIVRHYQEHLAKMFPTLQLEFILANPEAHASNCRFKEEDLNRAFEFLHEKRSTYEHQRAHDILKQIKSSPCVVIDLHTTTSNMGNTVIISHYNPLNLDLCAKLAAHFEDCRIIGAPDPKRKYLASQSDFGLILEIGPIANSVVAAAPLESTLSLIEFILRDLSAPETTKIGRVELYEETQDISYPKSEKGELNGYIHSEFQDSDFREIEGEFIPFKTFQNEEILMKTSEKLYPIFINEAAYYPQQLAFTLCRKKLINY